MNRRIAKGIVIGLAAAALVGGLTACGSGSSGEVPYDILVTYNYNVSHLLDGAECPAQYLGLKFGPNGEAPLTHEPGFDAERFELGTLRNSYLEGWYRAEKDEETGLPVDEEGYFFRQDSTGNAIRADIDGFLLDGEGEYLVTIGGERLHLDEYGLLSTSEKKTSLIMESRGQVKSLDGKTSIRNEKGEKLTVTRVKVALDLNTKWNFATDRVEEDLTLYANFVDTPRIVVLDENDEEVAFYDGDFGAQAKKPANNENPRKSGYTFYGFYQDKGFETPFTDADWAAHTYPTLDDLIDHTHFEVKIIYAKFIEGVWNVVRTTDELDTAIRNGRNVYLDNDLDFSGVEFPYGGDYGATFEGNGHTISNINFTVDVMTFGGASGSKFGLFATLQSTAIIRNVKFDKLSFSFSSTASRRLNVGLIAGVANEGATLEKVTFTDCVLFFGDVSFPGMLKYGTLFGSDEGATLTETTDDGITVENAPDEED